MEHPRDGLVMGEVTLPVRSNVGKNGASTCVVIIGHDGERRRLLLCPLSVRVAMYGNVRDDREMVASHECYCLCPRPGHQCRV